MYYIVNYKLHQQYVERRTPHRPAHFKLLKEYIATGELLMGGACDDQRDAIIIFRVEDIARIHDFIEADPYIIHEVAVSYTIRQWNMVTGEVVHSSLI